ncbi:porin [Grimontia sp. NTOU-MAR1]|uniref:porin n=1 Tax=Grimontia sp. NTOU-MAR1 TaxID=3111011 RepID=UPI002DBD43E7|nr:porin [Grimontia sp. NTOU-MAR1]WRV97406.1 porin [Grimontia sp. NTOU-MAR1]
MEKMFKRSVLGAAVALAAVSGSANAAIELAGEAVQLYGQAAGFMQWNNNTASDKSVSTTIESRIGFRGVVEFEDFGPDLLWQIEGGNANHGGFDPDKPWTHNDNGQLGARDTYLGLNFDGVGSFKYGRQLVAAYNYVDWPHSNPGLGNVFDWNNDIGNIDVNSGDLSASVGGTSFEDRADNVLRFDSATWNGFNFQATLSGMAANTDQMITSVAASYSQDMFSVHGGYYTQKGFGEGEEKGGDQSYYIVGGSFFIDSFTLTASMKHMENDAAKGKIDGAFIDNVDAEQTAYSATAQYVLDGKWVFKAGYAATSKAKFAGVEVDGTQDKAVNARLGYLLPSTYLFLDSRNYKMNNSDDWDNNVLAGVEYYF